MANVILLSKIRNLHDDTFRHSSLCVDRFKTKTIIVPSNSIVKYNFAISPQQLYIYQFYHPASKQKSYHIIYLTFSCKHDTSVQCSARRHWLWRRLPWGQVRSPRGRRTSSSPMCCYLLFKNNFDLNKHHTCMIKRDIPTSLYPFTREPPPTSPTVGSPWSGISETFSSWHCIVVVVVSFYSTPCPRIRF